MRRVAFHTLGCKVNFYDTDAVAETFRRRDYEVVPWGGAVPADVYVINTCSVTNTGAKKSRQFIRRAVQQNPRAIVVAMGCYAQFAPGEVARIPGVDLVVGSHRRGEIVAEVERIAAGERPTQPINLVENLLKQRTYEELPARSFDGRTRATLKVQDGCNAFCAFCQIPWSRGKNRSRRPEHVVGEAKALAELGYREVVVSGVHIGTYGADLEQPLDLAELLARLHDVAGLERIRLSSIDPHEVTDRLIEALVSLPRVCRHLHVAAQSGDDDVLLAMRRRNRAGECRARIERLRSRLPDIAVTTDIIAGFPGETEAQFQNTLDFCRALEFSKVHVF
ncbi:MAG TPA: tRNA (N(6)-L-threonylcarbamoyladenosine(37)-C(2))-methylthiotransferase MtaB, partial [Limnochordia bacterium]|nr:tRNA (N(6)-L-threonylcarbamoyladenosine(37)-C(2))-methylthiotransferase MtaB [Limnochordia bacterium]